MTTPVHINVKQLALREWFIISGLLLLLVAALVIWNPLQTLNNAIYDKFLTLNPHDARDDIIIVAIDDYSLAELGKWPWSRSRHAELIKRLNQTQARAIGMDFVFTEAEVATEGTSSPDLQLADALASNHHTVLPVTTVSAGKGLTAARPIPILAKAASEIGHINLEIDRDGVVRSVFLKEGIQGEWWSQFALAIKEAGNKNIQIQDNQLPGARLSGSQKDGAINPKAWQRDFQIHIPFYGGSGTFKSVPYVSVLQGEVPADFFKGKYVLIGPTAIAMSDSFPTPVSGIDGVVSGVEIHANILASLLDGRTISFAGWFATLLFCGLPVAIAMISYFFWTPRNALILTGGLFFGILLTSFLALTNGLWLPPAAALLTLVIAYPLWSWRRLEAALTYLGEEFALLDKEPHLLPELSEDEEQKPRGPISDTLEKRIAAMRSAAQRVRDLRQYVTDSLNSLPDATLVTTTDGNVLLCNPPAKTYFASIGMPKVEDSLMPYLFSQMSRPQALDNSNTSEFSWWNLLDLKQAPTISNGIEVTDKLGRNVIIKSAACYSAKKTLIGWIVSIIDISAIRSAERSRDETLHFISHDMRAPQASILALLELQQFPNTALPQEEFFARIEKSSRITLGLADNFVQLARAESQDYRLEDLDFQNVLLDATEEMWTLARSKNIKIVTKVPDDGEFPVRVDRSLMTRVLTNLLSNAIKYSPKDTTITCTLEYQPGLVDAKVICSISDQGYGIARADQGKLFQRFQRFKGEEQPKNDGIGLGMVFVKAVIDHHKGQISFVSAPNEGTTFYIQLPAYTV